MATERSPQTLKDELASYNTRLDRILRGRYGMSLQTFKTIKASAQLTGGLAGAYAMYLGAPPWPTMVLVATIISGPEILEYLINNAEPN